MREVQLGWSALTQAVFRTWQHVRSPNWGFVRVLGQAQQYGSSVAQARELLLKVKNSHRMRWTFIPDDRDISHLPRWVRTPKQTTDGHLAELANTNQAVLAKLDRRIPGGFVIPESRHS